MTQHDWERLLDDAKADGQATARVRERWLVRQAEESATFAGTLLDLAETGTRVSVALDGQVRREGALVAIGRDFVVLEDRGEHVVVALDAISVVRPAPGGAATTATGDRAGGLDLTFGELLARLVDDRGEVALVLRGGDSLRGSLVAVGADVLTVRVAPGADGLAYCSLAAVSSARLRSG